MEAGPWEDQRDAERRFRSSREPELVSPQFVVDNTCYHNFWNHENSFLQLHLLNFAGPRGMWRGIS